MKRHELTDLRDAIKAGSGALRARERLLAYAFLRGVPYRACGPITRPAAFDREVYFWARLLRDVAARLGRDAAELREQLAAWMAAPETDERRAWRLGREAAGRARLEARRAAFRARHEQGSAASRGA